MPAGLRARRPTWDDLPAVAELYRVCSLDRVGTVTLREADLRVRWLELGDFDDALLLEAPATESAAPGAARAPGSAVAGYVAADTAGDPDDDAAEVFIDGRVHPSWTGRGIASFLLDWAEDRAVAVARDRGLRALLLRTAVVDGDDRARAFFTRRGFEPIRHLLRLRLDLHADPPAPVWPPGVTARALVPGRDEEAAWRTHQAAFADVPTHLPLDLDTWVEDRLRREPVDADLVLLAEHEGEPVGLAVCAARAPAGPSDGWVRDLGVVPAWRRRGIGMALLRTAFAAFRRRGLTGVALEVDDVTLDGAVALYRRAGMRVVHRTDVVERVVRLDDEPGQRSGRPGTGIRS